MKQARKLPICLLSVCCILYADVHSQTIKRRENQNLEVRQDQDALLVVKLTDVVSEAVQLWKHPEKPVPKNSDVLDLRLPPMVYDAIFIEDLLYVLFASEGELKVDVLRKGEHETYQSLKIYTFQTTFAVGANEGRRFAESANIEVADGDISVELIESGGKKLRWRGRGNGDSVTWESIKSLPSARKSDSSLLDAAGSVEKLVRIKK